MDGYCGKFTMMSRRDDSLASLKKSTAAAVALAYAVAPLPGKARDDKLAEAELARSNPYGQW